MKLNISKNIKIFLFGIMILIIILLTSCGAFITEGIVTNKTFIPEHTESKVITTFVSTGKITVPITSPRTINYPDEWKITFEGENKDGEKVSRTISVKKEVFNKYKIGDYIDINNI